MKHFAITILFFILGQTISAQDAPDFTVTDSQGDIHHLYSDYLDQGKTVVLKLFFVECPPCASIAPLFEGLYQTWGAGNADVEFICMTTKNWNSNNNAGVAAYLTSHNLTYLGVGNDGGSLDATEPYTSGSFGGYYGTPTFVVIAPDKSVIYNPNGGSTLEGRIEAINQAIISTGAVGGGSNSQTIFNINLSNTVDSVFLQNGDGSNRVLISSTDDVYTIALPDDIAYPGISDPHLFMVKNEDPSIGLNIVDIIKTKRHTLFLEPFQNPLSLIAADLNSDGSINIGDIVTLTRLALLIYDGLPDGSPMFRFISDQCPDTDSSCLNGIPLLLNPGTTNNLAIDVIKMGNVSATE